MYNTIIYTILAFRFQFVYILAPIAVLLVFFIWKPKYTLWAVPICAALNLLFYVQEVLCYEGRGLILMCAALQAAVIAILAYIIRDLTRKRW